jgi:hypothetical protein
MITILGNGVRVRHLHGDGQEEQAENQNRQRAIYV